MRSTRAGADHAGRHLLRRAIRRLDTAILINMPGETSSVVTAIDGYQMARQGRAGAALAIAAIGSFFAGCVGTLISGVRAAARRGGLKFGPAEYFSLMVLGLLAAVVLAPARSQGDRHGRARPAARAGRHRRQLGPARYSFGIPRAGRRHRLRVVAMGVFGIGEIISNLGHRPRSRGLHQQGDQPGGRTWERLQGGVARYCAAPPRLFLRRAAGHGPPLASFSSYMLEKKLAAQPRGSQFGKGAIEGVAAPDPPTTPTPSPPSSRC